jgi:hypothetical protein
VLATTAQLALNLQAAPVISVGDWDRCEGAQALSKLL